MAMAKVMVVKNVMGTAWVRKPGGGGFRTKQRTSKDQPGGDGFEEGMSYLRPFIRKAFKTLTVGAMVVTTINAWNIHSSSKNRKDDLEMSKSRDDFTRAEFKQMNSRVTKIEKKVNEGFNLKEQMMAELKYLRSILTVRPQQPEACMKKPQVTSPPEDLVERKPEYARPQSAKKIAEEN